MEHPENRTNRSTNTSRLVPVLIFLVLFLYPLSIGPFAWLDRHRIVSKPVMDVVIQIYFPIDWLYDRSDRFREILDWYILYPALEITRRR